MFLVAVAVCAVFFAAGFLVGFNERAVKNPPVTEAVSASSSAIPPVVNPAPAETAKAKEETVTEGNPVRESAEPLTVPPLSSPRPVGKTARAPGHEKAEPVASPVPEGRSYTVQVSASAIEAKAQKVIAELKAEGFPVFLAPQRRSRAGHRLFRVRVGPYPTREEAENVRDKLVQSGFKRPFIKH